MRHREGFLKGVRDANTYYQYWLPEGEPKAVLLIVHGLAEHSGRYMNLVNHFVPLGYGVYGIDHLGHGKSEGTRVYVERFEDFTDTLKIYFEMIREWQPDSPIVLIGHSLGALIGPLYLLDHQAGLAGAVFSASFVKVPDYVPSPIIFVCRVLSVLTPKLGLFGIDAEGVSRDPNVVQAYVNDPLVYRGKTTARLGAEIFKAMQRIAAEATKITLPVLVLHGGADRLVDLDGAQMLYDQVSSADKTIKIYDRLYHEVFNEPEHDQVLHDVEVWLEAHLVSRI